MAALLESGVPHHVAVRGYRRRRLFFLDPDRRFFLGLLGFHGSRSGLLLHGYCLMDNHFHLVCTLPRAGALAAVLGPLLDGYGDHLRRRHGLQGRVWGRLAPPVPLRDGEGFRRALRYVERNPLRAGLVERPEAWPWSSAPAHCGLGPDPLLTPPAFPPGEAPAWRAALAGPD